MALVDRAALRRDRPGARAPGAGPGALRPRARRRRVRRAERVGRAPHGRLTRGSRPAGGWESGRMEIQLSMLILEVRDLARSIAFYRDLGLDVPDPVPGRPVAIHRMGSGVSLL